jgi:predicted nucleic acid-binding protein
VILVDTSVMIGYLKGSKGDIFDKLDEIIDKDIPFGINSYIYQELLQGSKNEKEYSRLQEYLRTLPFYDLKNGKVSFEKAAYLYLICRKNGVTIRSTIDLLIAETAIENDLYLLHNDKDFTYLGKVVKELKIYD